MIENKGNKSNENTRREKSKKDYEKREKIRVETIEVEEKTLATRVVTRPLHKRSVSNYMREGLERGWVAFAG